MPRPRRSPQRPWSDGLPPELLGSILLKLTCLADRVYFSAVCRPWRSAARGLDAPPRQLPWLLFPASHTPFFYSLHSGATRRLHLPESVRGARLCGSHDGGWVALALDQWRGYAALNLLSGERVPLPDRLRTNLPSLHGHIGHNACEHPMVIRTVTFSAAPSAQGCLAAAHVSSTFNIAFWRPGMDRHWVAHGLPVDVIQDMLYHKNELKEGFHVLSDTEDVTVYTPSGGPGAPLAMSHSSYQVQRRADYKSRRYLCRYLVESRGKLLMVLRHPYQRRSRRYRIFEMNHGIAPGGGSQASWVELHALPGRLLLLGRGCSRAFEASQFNRLQVGNICCSDDRRLFNRFQVGNIYCLDDTRFNISLVLKGGRKRYMGVNAQRKRTRRTRRLLRRFTSERSRSSPIWFAP